MKSDDPTDPNKNPLGLLVRSASNFFIDGWLLMLAFGVVHASAHGVPALGYWQSTFLAWVLAGIAASGNVELVQRVKNLGKLVKPGAARP